MAELDVTYEWSTLRIGGGGWMTGLVVHDEEPGAVYARTDVSGAYRYIDDEDRWEQMITVDGLGDDFTGNEYSVEALAVAPSDPQVVYLSVGNDDPPSDGDPDGTGRVLSSSDGGRTWSSSDRRWVISGNAEHRQRSERLGVDPDDPDHVILGTRHEGVWQSEDGGVEWSPVEDLPAGPEAESETDPAGVTFVEWGSGEHDDRVWIGIEGEGVFESEDSGQTWDQVRGDLDAAVAPFEGTYVDGVLMVTFKRTDGELDAWIGRFDVMEGEWSDVTPDHPAPVWSVAISPHDTDRLVAAPDMLGDSQFWRSDDGGSTWEGVEVERRSEEVPWVTADDGSWMFIGRLVFDPHEVDRLWFAEGRGAWTADDVFDGEVVEWQARVTGLEQTVTADLVVPPSGDPVSAVADHQGFHHTDVDGFPEHQLVDEEFAGGTDLDFSGGDPDHLVWIGAEYHRYWQDSRRARGAVSTDGGQSWTELPNLDDDDQFGGNVAMSAFDPDNIVWVPSYIHPWEYEEDSRGVFVTDDGGESWTRPDGIDGSQRFHRLVWWLTRRALAADRVEGGVFYLNDDEGGFWTSVDEGFSWDEAPHAPPCLEANECHVFGQLRTSPDSAREVWASVGQDGLYRTADAGDTEWEPVPDVDEARAFDFGAPLDGSSEPTIFLHGRVHGDEDLGVWRSPDGGTTWELIGRHPDGNGRGITVVAGDPERAGRVYLGTSGVGFLYGDDPNLEADR